MAGLLGFPRVGWGHQGVTGRSGARTATCWAEAECRRGWGERLACTAWAELAGVRKLERPRVKRARWGTARSTRASSSSTMAASLLGSHGGSGYSRGEGSGQEGFCAVAHPESNGSDGLLGEASTAANRRRRIDGGELAGPARTW